MKQPIKKKKKNIKGLVTEYEKSKETAQYM